MPVPMIILPSLSAWKSSWPVSPQCCAAPIKCALPKARIQILKSVLISSIQKNNVLDRTFALKSIWHDDNYFNGRSMDVYIAKLRKYLKDDSKVEIINIHGKGFKLLVNP